MSERMSPLMELDQANVREVDEELEVPGLLILPGSFHEAFRPVDPRPLIDETIAESPDHEPVIHEPLEPLEIDGLALPDLIEGEAGLERREDPRPVLEPLSHELEVRHLEGLR
jgi:hypothetical protein